MWFVTRFGGDYVCDAFVVWALSVRMPPFFPKCWMVELFYFLFGGCTAPLNVPTRHFYFFNVVSSSMHTYRHLQLFCSGSSSSKQQQQQASSSASTASACRHGIVS